MTASAADPAPGAFAETYLDIFDSKLQLLRESISKEISPVAQALATSIAHGGVVHVWGSGHSFVLAKELFYRAGGLVEINPLFDENLVGIRNGSLSIQQFDQQVGYSPRILDGHEIRPGEFLIIFSPSGLNVSAVDLALAARRLEMRVVAVTSRTLAESADSQHPTAAKLHEIAEFVIDNPIDPGDAVVSTGDGVNAGGTSIGTGIVICQLLAVETISSLMRMNIRPNVVRAASDEKARAANRSAFESVRERLKHL